MPPKKGGFLLPGTPASKKKKKKEAQPTRGIYVDGRRDIAQEFALEFADTKKLEEVLLSLSKKHLRPLAQSTLDKYARARRIWLVFWTWYLGSEEAALATLAPDAPSPPTAPCKLFFGRVAEKGRSGLGMGLVGWSYRTSHEFVKTTQSMLLRQGATGFGSVQILDIFNYIENLAKVDGVLPTAKREKRLVRQTDFIDFLAGVLSRKVAFSSGYRRIQVMAFAQILFVHGLRPGCLVESGPWVGWKHFLKWDHIEWIIVGFEPGVGLAIQSFWTLHYMKNMRLDDALFIRISSRSLPKNSIIADPQMSILAMAIRNNVFEEDLITLFSKKEAVDKLSLPYTLTVRPEFVGRPVFTQRRGSSEDTAPRIATETPVIPSGPSRKEKAKETAPKPKQDAPRKKLTDVSEMKQQTFRAPMTYASISYSISKVGKGLGWKGFNMKSFRYSFSDEMTAKIPDAHLRYLMGHTAASDQAETVYQVPDRPVDVSAIRFNMEQDTSISDLRSSVAWKKDATKTLDVDVEKLKSNSKLSELLEALRVAEARVFAKYKCSSKDVPNDALDDDLVEDASDAWADVLMAYAHLSANMDGSRPTSRMSMTSDRRSRSNSVSSDVSMMSAQPASVDDSMLDPQILEESARARAASIPPAFASSPVTPPIAPPASASNIESLACPAEVDDMLAQQLGQLDLSHPFQQAVLAEKENPRFLFLSFLLTMMKSDDLQCNGICPYCFSDEALKPNEQLRNWSAVFSYHVWKCEDRKMAGHWRCPVCADMLKCTADSPEEEESIQNDLKAHRTACYAAACITMKLVRGAVAEEEEEEEEADDGEEGGELELEPEVEGDDVESKSSKGKNKSKNRGAFGKGYKRLTVASRIGSAIRALSRYFCPICWFLLEGCKKSKAQREGDTDPRFTVFLGGLELSRHLVTHFASLSRNPEHIGGIDYDLTFTCGFPECSNVGSMKTGKMITHLHVAHDYRLVECSVVHAHTAQCYELPERDFLTTTDAELKAKHLGGTLPTTNLRDCRRPNVQTTQRKKILALAAKSGNESSNAVETVQPSGPSSEESSLVQKIRLCMADFAKAHPDVPGIAEVTEYLVEEEIEADECGEITAKDIKENSEVQWRMKQVVSWRTFYKQWFAGPTEVLKEV